MSDESIIIIISQSIAKIAMINNRMNMLAIEWTGIIDKREREIVYLLG